MLLLCNYKIKGIKSASSLIQTKGKKTTQKPQTNQTPKPYIP